MNGSEFYLSVKKQYVLLHGLFWMTYCVGGSFVSLYLQERGIDNTGIGVVTALCGTGSAILQPLLGRVCDRSSVLTWKKMILLLEIPFLIICILMLFVPGRLAASLFIGLLSLLAHTIPGFLNAAMSYYQNHGISVNFGVSRGTGSGTFALAALVLGKLADIHGSIIVPVAGIVLSLMFLVIVVKMPCEHTREVHRSSADKASGGFVQRYPAFTLMVAAFATLATTQHMVLTYMLQIIQSLGGGSSELGKALALQAIVEIPMLFGFNRLRKRFRSNTLMVIAAFGFGIKSVAYCLAGSIFAIYLVQCLQIISFAIYVSACVYYTMDVVDVSDQVTGMALMTSVLAIGTVAGGLIGGVIIDSLGIPALLLSNVAIAAVGIIMVLISNRMLKHQK